MSRTHLVLLTLLTASLANAGEPRVKEVRQQRVGDVTYFRVVLAELPGYVLTELPRLVPQDDRTTAIAYRVPHGGRDSTRELVFLGKAVGEGAATCLLLYPVDKKTEKPPPDRLLPSLDRVGWVEQTVTLTLRHPAATPAVERRRTAEPKEDDLEGQWAAAHARHFAEEEARSSEFGYATLAREALGRKFNVPAKPLAVRATGRSALDDAQRLYEMTTGASALAETLAMRRLLGGPPGAPAPRVDDVATLPGVNIAEHPWRKMMGERKPAAEPLAKLIPHDHYYVAFNSIRKFLDFGELLEQWGSPLQQGFELQVRDYELKRRYERQLCLRSSGLGRTLGPALIRGVAVTGSDLYVREGADVTVLFQVRSSDLFFAAVEPFLVEARKEFGRELKEAKEKYRDVAIESYTTPLREVSLHRAAINDVVVYANSGVALRRILDTHLRRRPALSDMLDFQYMRTVFRADDKDEDGFAYLSDAFIRQQVGPAGKIKEKRRLEALASLQTMTHAALFHAWHTGRLPRDATQLQQTSGLRLHEVAVPEGNSPSWSATRRVAVSDAYNTIHFLTPLLELPIDKVTAEERQEYARFREEYLRNWRQFFDPVGFRFQLRESQARVEMYLLPLVENSDYSWMRRLVGTEPLRFDLATLGPQTLLQYTMGLNPAALGFGLEKALGDRVFWRLEDGPGYGYWVRRAVARERERVGTDYSPEDTLPLLSSSWLLGVRMNDEKEFDNLIALIPHLFQNLRISTTRQETLDYRGVKIRTYRIDPDDPAMKKLNPPQTPEARRVEGGLCWMKLDGVFYLATYRASLQRLVDQRDRPPKGDTVAINGSVYLSAKGGDAGGCRAAGVPRMADAQARRRRRTAVDRPAPRRRGGRPAPVSRLRAHQPRRLALALRRSPRRGEQRPPRQSPPAALARHVGRDFTADDVTGTAPVAAGRPAFPRGRHPHHRDAPPRSGEMKPSGLTWCRGSSRSLPAPWSSRR